MEVEVSGWAAAIIRTWPIGARARAPIAVSNVALLNPATGKADRVGFKVLADGRKVRVFKSNGEVVDA